MTVIYFLRADVSQRQPPVHGALLYLHWDNHKEGSGPGRLVIYKQHPLLSRWKSYTRPCRLKRKDSVPDFTLRWQNERKKQPLREDEGVCFPRHRASVKETWFDPNLWRRSHCTVLLWSGLRRRQRGPLQRHAGLCQLHKQPQRTWHHPAIIREIRWRLAVQQVQAHVADGG